MTAALLCAVLSVFAQGSGVTGLSGTVYDEGGAVITGASVRAFNYATGLERHATTDGEGAFVIPLLPPGRYSLTVQRDGFKTVDVRDLSLADGDRPALRVRLPVGHLDERIVVTAELDDGVGTGGRHATVSAVFGPRAIQNLPLNGRSFQSLISLVPGAVVTRADFNEQGQFSVNGQRPNGNYYTIDGVSANFGVSAGPAPGQAAAGSLPALSSFGTTNNLVSADAVEELRVHTSTYEAEFGRTPGAQVVFRTRSGTDELRGTVLYNLRRRALEANDWFVNAGGLAPPPSRHDNFAATLGGPVVEGRTFFFLSYEWLDALQPRVAATGVPSEEVRSRAAPEFRPLLDAFPRPRAGGRDLGLGMTELAAGYGEPYRLSASSVRLDHVVGPGLSFFGRFAHSPSRSSQRASFNPPTASARATFGGGSHFRQSLSTVNDASFETSTLTAGAAYSVGSRATGEARFNWSRARGSNRYRLDDFAGAVPPADSYLFPPFASPAGGLVQIVVLAPAGQGANLRAGKDADNSNRQLNAVATLSLLGGAHHFKLGADYRRLSGVFDAPSYTQTVSFSSFDGNPLPFGPANVLSGSATARIFAEAAARRPVFHNLSLFAQDAWRLGRRLSLSYGLRWELSPAPRGEGGDHAAVLTNALSLRQGVPDIALQFAPDGAPLWETTYGNFAPRVGLAYEFARWPGATLRAGFGVYYDLGGGQAAQSFGSVFPFTRGHILANVPYPLRPADAAPRPPGAAAHVGTLFAFDPRLRLPYTRQWSLTLEKGLGAGYLLSVSHLGAQGRRLLREEVFSFAPPFLPGAIGDRTIVLTTGAAESDYRALQAQLRRRLSSGLEVFAAYTWSRSTDTASDDSTLSRHDQFAPDPGRDRGPSDFDVRHSASAAVAYDLPSPFKGGPGRALTRRWSLDALVRWRTALPVNVARSAQLISGGIVIDGRPNLLPGVPVYLTDARLPGGRAVNPAAFTNAAGLGGPLGRNALRGFGASQLDVTLRRTLALSERLRLQLRAEVYNLLNQPNFADPSPVFGPAFGANPDNASTGFVSTQTLGQGLGTGGAHGGLIPMYQLGGARSVQLGVRLQF